MKKYIITLIMVFASIPFNSCDQDYLDIPQRGAINTDEYYAKANDAQADALIAYVYKYVFSNTGPDWMVNWGSAAWDLPGMSNVNVTSTNHFANSMYSFLYRVNYLCNRIIEDMNEDSPGKTIVKGEAYFWRAWAYMYLIQGWGTPPLVDHQLAPGELPGNGDPAELWDYVFTSLDEAIARLPQKAGIDSQDEIGGRVTKHSAYALLGKAQLWKGDYEDAVTSLGMVITSGLYGLIDDYSGLYHNENDFCKEYIWEWNIDDNDLANYTNETDNRAISMGWRSENVLMPGNGYCGKGWGTAANFSENFYDFMIARGEKGLPRYMGTIWDYEDALDKFIEWDGASNRTEAIDMFWRESPVLVSSEGYMRAKMYVFCDEIYPPSGSNDYLTFNNWPGMRYAEVLLNYAEASVLSGTNLTEGRDALNLVRQRAGLDELGSITLQDVKDEKRAELVLEGNRYLDLIRWGDASAELNNRGFFTYSFKGYVAGTDPENGSTADYEIITEPTQGATNFVIGRDELFPFPYSEVLLNPNLDQNLNW